MLLLAAALLPACEENAVTEIAEPPVGGASVKFFNFSPSSPNVNFYANDTKVTAILATTCTVITDANREQCTTVGAEATTGVAYGSSANGANAWYSDIAPGQYSFSGRIAAATDKGLAIATIPGTVADGKFYSVYLSGVYNTTTKTTEGFIVEDVIPELDYTGAYVRLVNAVSTSTGPMTLYIKDRTTLVEIPVGGEVAYKAGGAFVKVPNGSYDLSVRYAGSATSVIARTNVGFSVGRVYTITARGTTATASTLALDNTANR